MLRDSETEPRQAPTKLRGTHLRQEDYPGVATLTTAEMIAALASCVQPVPDPQPQGASGAAEGRVQPATQSRLVEVVEAASPVRLAGQMPANRRSGRAGG